ncbi:universal stress protein [Antarcticibacterium sp. 1MA-6-2]|uniref:universal stress protein n=1 Tax=Antarcticibacterium sp. 1MA-6-2 TaxID=2908210 RepID=UPI001F34302E|nr:universal stress protein [Antarcticibacterium sp. 1MA-6-2]UJH92876.1 universal stress protein [Antarcticibacterium sp. 1MA-6-2]
MKNILVAIDEPKEADQLTAHAVEIAKLNNAKIWIIHVTEAVPKDFISREAGPQYLYDRLAENNKKEAAAIKQWANELTETHQVAAEGLLIEGSVIKSIKKIVEERDIDLVVAGHRKRNFLYGLFTENKKKDLIDELKIPLLAVPLQ